MADAVYGTEDAIATNLLEASSYPSRPCFCLCCLFLCLVFCFACLCLFFVFCFRFLFLCFARVAWECSLDYVQVHNRLLLKLVYGHACEFTNLASGTYNLLNDLAKAMKALDRKKLDVVQARSLLD